MSVATYEARVLGAHLPYHTVAFTFPKAGIPFSAGIFKIEYVRNATDADDSEFPHPPHDKCVMCGRPEE
jgi:hypothetical protein